MTSATALALGEIRKELNARYYEREDVVTGLLLALLSKQHGFILGDPGTGKSMLIRDLASRIEGADYFETLLSKNRPDQAVLGPYDLPLLRDEGEFRRKDAGYLTTAHIAFLDELGKMSPTLGHDLLPVLNERIKHEVGADGRSRCKVPLHTALAASNEHPAAESEDAAALWDRMLVRMVVQQIQADRNFRDLMDRSDAEPTKRTTITLEDLNQAVEEASMVALPEAVLDGVLAIRAALRTEGITVSDRRWRDSMSVVRAYAWLNERDVAEREDLVALKWTLWDDLERRRKVERLVLRTAAPVVEEVEEFMDELAELLAGLRSRQGESREKLAQFAAEVVGKTNVVENKAKKLAEQNGPVTQPLLDRVVEVRDEVSRALGLK